MVAAMEGGRMRPEDMERFQLIAEVERLRLKNRAHRRCLREQGHAIAERNRRISALEAETERLRAIAMVPVVQIAERMRSQAG